MASGTGTFQVTASSPAAMPVSIRGDGALRKVHRPWENNR